MENAEHFTGHTNTDIIVFPQVLPYSARSPLSAAVNSLVITVEPFSPCLQPQ